MVYIADQMHVCRGAHYFMFLHCEVKAHSLNGLRYFASIMQEQVTSTWVY